MKKFNNLNKYLHAFKLQIPVKPTANKKTFYICGEEAVEIQYCCGKCGKFICYKEEPNHIDYYSHCPSGHAIDWSDYE